MTSAELSARAVEALREAFRGLPRQELPALLAEVERARAEVLLAAAGPPAPERGKTLTPGEVAGRLGKGADWAYRHRHSLPTVPLPGGRWGVPEADLERWIKRRAKS